MLRSLIIIFFIVSLSGCDLRSRELAIEKREADLKEREQQLILKEKDIMLREEALRRQNIADSIAADSTVIIPGLEGSWSVKMTCTETTCSGSAVGDTKSETWNLAYQGNHIIARAMEGDKLVRVYSGSFNGKTLVLKENVDQQGVEPAASLTVRLNVVSQGSMEGDREIVRQNGCRIVYRIQMNQQKLKTL